MRASCYGSTLHRVSAKMNLQKIHQSDIQTNKHIVTTYCKVQMKLDLLEKGLITNEMHRSN